MHYAEAGPFGRVLVREPEPDEELVAFQMHLLIRNRPDYILPCYLRYRSGIAQLCAEVTGLRVLAEHPDLIADPDAWLSHIRACLLDAADRLLSPAQFQLQPADVYLNEQGQPYLLFWPIRTRLTADWEDKEAEAPPNLNRRISAPNADDLILEEAVSELRRFFSERRVGALRPTEMHSSPEHISSGNPEPILLSPADQQDDKTAAGKPQATRKRSKQHRSAAAVAVSDAPPASSAGNNDHFHPRRNVWRRCVRYVWLVLMIVLPFLLGALFILQRTGHVDKLPAWLNWPIDQTRLALILFLVADLFWLTLRRRANKRQQAAIGRHSGRIGSARWFHTLRLWLGLSEPDSDESSDSDATDFRVDDPDQFRIGVLSEVESAQTPDGHREDEQPRVFILVDDFLIGRDERCCDLVIADRTVGRRHASIRRKSGSFFLADLGSRNGTRLDGRRLPRDSEHLLPEQSRIEIGNRTYVFSSE